MAMASAVPKEIPVVTICPYIAASFESLISLKLYQRTQYTPLKPESTKYILNSANKTVKTLTTICYLRPLQSDAPEPYPADVSFSSTPALNVRMYIKSFSPQL